LGRGLKHIVKFAGKRRRDRLIPRLSAEGDGLFKGLKTREAGQAFGHVGLDVTARFRRQFLIDVFREHFKQLEAMPVLGVVTRHE
jgi:hypothetical protein